MRLYFAGIESADEYRLLREASVTDVVVDPGSCMHLDLPQDVAIVLESGTRRLFRQGITRFSVTDWMEKVVTLEDYFRFDMVLAPEVVGNPLMTRQVWERLRGFHDRLVPVWALEASLSLLEHYLGESEVVCVGGLDGVMRRQEQAALVRLEKLCRRWPQRLHIAGCNWLDALEAVKDHARSADTSKWMDGALTDSVIFLHGTRPRLCQASARDVREQLGVRERRDACIFNARVLDEHCNTGMPIAY